MDNPRLTLKWHDHHEFLFYMKWFVPYTTPF
jgi:hypothetical protein